MSYARFNDGSSWPGRSDVYVFLSSTGLECCGCWLSPKSLTFETTDAIVAHLREHQAAGHVVPDFTFEGLEEDREANEAYLRTGDAAFLD